MAYIPHTKEDREAMLATIGVDSIERLFREVPDDLLLNEALDVPHKLSEHGLLKRLSIIAAMNRCCDELVCFLGAGIYDKFIPSSVGTVISRGEFLTAYTPYQPEASQGYLQTIYEFQTMIANLYGMDMANASMYDGGTAMAEAALMCCAITGRDRILVSEGVHPHFRKVLATYCWASGKTIERVPTEAGATTDPTALDDGVACLIVAYPNFLGTIESLEMLVGRAHDRGAMLVAVAEPSAMALLPPPGELGADVTVGEGQSLGIPMGFGGPLLGLFACQIEHARQIPGRIVGATVDTEGRRAYTMTLRTREQDIKRERASSNICTNEALMALAATVYLSAVGKNGLRSIAESCVRNARYAMGALTDTGAKLKWPDARVFNEFVLELPRPAGAVRDALIDEGILAGYLLGDDYPELENCLLVCTTELRGAEEIDQYASSLRKVLA